MMRVALVTTGGTIVSLIDPATGRAMPVLDGERLLDGLRGRSDAAGIDAAAIEVHDLMCVASPQIGLDDWVALHRRVQQLVARDDIGAVIVTHGTSTLEETAWFLDLTVRTDKPIVLTGAQRNASEADFDGPRNLIGAIRVGQADAARGLGVLVVLNDHVNAAREVTKTHTLDVETFSSGEWGFLGAVQRHRVVFHRAPLRRLHIPLHDAVLPLVDVVAMYPGATGALVGAAIDHGAQGVVIAAVASGHVNAAMAAAIERVLAAGTPVVVSTRIPRGGTREGYGFDGASSRLVEAGAVLSDDLSPWKARILLMLALQAGLAQRDPLSALFRG